jgi:hypothetical protein
MAHYFECACKATSKRLFNILLKKMPMPYQSLLTAMASVYNYDSFVTVSCARLKAVFNALASVAFVMILERSIPK